MMIIKIEATANGQHLFQSQSHRSECWIDGYVAVPQRLESNVISCLGYCDLTIKNGVLTDVQEHLDLIPKKETAEPISTTERLEALEMAMLEMALGGAE